MNTANKLLDKFAGVCSAKTDTDIAAKLHVTKSAVSNWRRGKAHPDAASVELMADAIGEPFGIWLASIQAERTHTPKDRKVWLRLAQSLAAVLAITFLTALPHFLTAGPVSIM